MSEIKGPESPSHNEMVQGVAAGSQEAVETRGVEKQPLPEGNGVDLGIEKIRAEIKALPDAPKFTEGMDYSGGALDPQEKVLASQHNIESTITGNPVVQERRKKGFMDKVRGTWFGRKVAVGLAVLGIGVPTGVALSESKTVQQIPDTVAGYAKTVGDTAVASSDVARDGLEDMYNGAQQILQRGPEGAQGAENRATSAGIETKVHNNEINNILANNPNATEVEVNAQLDENNPSS